MSVGEMMLEKARERGYETVMSNGDYTWYSLYNSRWKLNLELYTETGEFVLNRMNGIIRITTDKCGSFMNDEHFNKIEREMRAVLFSMM
jgi:hypothetical protein